MLFLHTLVITTLFLNNVQPSRAANTYIASIVKVLSANGYGGFCSSYIGASSQPAVTRTASVKTATTTSTITSYRSNIQTSTVLSTTTQTNTKSVTSLTTTFVTSPTLIYITASTPLTTTITYASGTTYLTSTSTYYSTSIVTSTPPPRTRTTVFTTYTTNAVPIGFNKRDIIFTPAAGNSHKKSSRPNHLRKPKTSSLRHALSKNTSTHNNNPHAPAKTTSSAPAKTSSKSSTTPAKLVSTSIPAELVHYNKASLSAACRTLFRAGTTTISGTPSTSVIYRTVRATTALTTTTSRVATQTSQLTSTVETDTLTSTTYSSSFSTSTPSLSTVYQTTTSYQTALSVVSANGTTTTTTKLASPTVYTTTTTLSALPSPTFYDYRQMAFPNLADTVPDFSFAGYHASNDPLPNAGQAANIFLQSTNDQTDRTNDIQSALNNCHNQVVELANGNYYLNGGTVYLANSNCVLRGARNNQGDPQTIIIMTGAVRTLFMTGSPKSLAPIFNNTVNITDPYVPVGGTTFNVSDASPFSVGNTIHVQRHASQQWITNMGMDTLVRNGVNQTWIPVGAVLSQARSIVGISNNTITIDIPLTDAVDNADQYDNGTMASYSPPVTYSEIGIENLFILAVPDETGTNIVDGTATGIAFGSWSVDCWSRNVVFEGFNGPTAVNKYAMRITMAGNQFRRDLASDTSFGQAADVLLNGQQVLITGATTRDAPGVYSFGVTTGSAVPGPNVAFNCFAVGYDVVSPHQRWATGFLLDASVVAASQFWNRGTAGSGQGWTIGAGVNWNVVGYKGFTVNQPPISQNFAVGCIGTNVGGTGSIISPGQPVLPASLFAAQLAARIGSAQANAVLSY